MAVAVPAIDLRHFSKTFGVRQVLSDVSLKLMPGEIHGLVGQNGSGKSTMIKILSGYHHPDEGAELRVRGQDVALPLHPGQAQHLGIGFVHQDLGLVDSATVVENLRANLFDTHVGWRISWRDERRAAAAALARCGVELDPNVVVGSLRGFERALIAVARALESVQGAEGALLVLDEPTLYLPRDGVEFLFDAIRTVAARGTAVLFVSHRLEEMFELTDRVSVFRDGTCVATLETADTDADSLIELMLGSQLKSLYPEERDESGEVLLSASEVSGSGLDDVALDLRRGEVLGVTGLLGAGYEQLPPVLFGAAPADHGRLEVGDRSYDMRRLTPRAAMEEGIVLLPADRSRESSMPAATVLENLTLPTLGSYFLGGVLRHRRELARVETLLDEFDVRPPDPRRTFGTLSGGNQQKVLVAKWLERQPRVLLLHEPTQGVDIGARTQIFTQIRDAAQAGVAVILASAEYDDLAHLCDRVLVFRDGRVASELVGDNLSPQRIAEQCLRDHAGEIRRVEANRPLGRVR